MILDDDTIKLTEAYYSEKERANFLLKRKEELHGLLVRIALRRNIVAQLPGDIRNDLGKEVGDLIQ